MEGGASGSGTERVVRTQTYGICPNGHGDHNDEIAAEVSADARPYPNCPLCGYALEDTYEADIVRRVDRDTDRSDGLRTDGGSDTSATYRDLSRILLAKMLLWAAYKAAPQTWYDTMEESEARRIARRTGVLDCNSDTDTDCGDDVWTDGGRDKIDRERRTAPRRPTVNVPRTILKALGAGAIGAALLALVIVPPGAWVAAAFGGICLVLAAILGRPVDWQEIDSNRGSHPDRGGRDA